MDEREKEIEEIELGIKKGREIETTISKCEACGSNLVFDPNSGDLLCPHCGTTVELVSNSVCELDLFSALDSDSNLWDINETTVFSCDNCGARVLLDKGETAKVCPFCDTAHVQVVEDFVGLKPNGVLPFKFDKEKAVEYSKAWAKKRLFAPSKFKKNINTQNVNGVYMPAFTFDSVTTSYYKGRIGETRTRTVGSGKNRQVQTYVVWKNISGTYHGQFDDVLIEATSRIEQRQINKLAPFETNKGIEYDQKYLLGFMAYQYDDDVNSCWDKAKGVMDERLKREILSQYVYDRVDYLNVSTTHENVTYKYEMLPIYVGHFRYSRKNYNFFVNGESGKTTGKTPVSPWRVLIAILIGLGAIGLAVLLFLFFSGSI